MKILYILPFVPYPLYKGGNQAVFNMIEKARSCHDVSVLLYQNGHHDEDAMKELQTVWQDVTFYNFSMQGFLDEAFLGMTAKEKQFYRLHNYILQSMTRKIARAKKRGILRMKNTEETDAATDTLQGFNLGAFVKSRSTLYNSSNSLSADFLHYVYEVSRKGFDLIQVEFYEFLELAYVLPEDVNTVFVHHEIRFVRNENESTLFDHLSFYDQYLLNRKKAEELAALNTFRHIITLTDVDREILAQYLPANKIHVSPAVISTDESTENHPFTPAQDLVFVGGCDHFPNLDGLLWFCQDVMPRLQQAGTAIRLHVVGHWDDASRQLVKSLYPDAHFTGFVEDLTAFLNGKISIIPIRIGSGMRIKILDSIFASTPLVTTSKGCEGLPLQDGIDCCIADTAEDFATAIRNVQGNIPLQQKLTSAAIHRLRIAMNSQKLLSRRLEIYADIAEAQK